MWDEVFVGDSGENTGVSSFTANESNTFCDDCAPVKLDKLLSEVSGGGGTCIGDHADDVASTISENVI